MRVMAEKSDAYREVARISEPEGVVAIVTARDTDEGPRHTFGIFKEFVKPGQTEPTKTSYFNVRHLGAIERVLVKVKAKLEELRRGGGAAGVGAGVGAAGVGAAGAGVGAGGGEKV